MKTQTGIKFYLWFSGAVLPLWMINLFFGQPDGADFKAPEPQAFAEEYLNTQLAADRQPAMSLKPGYASNRNIITNDEDWLAAKHKEAAALNKSFFISQSYAVENSANQSATAMDQKEKARQSNERLHELALNIDKLSRQKLGQAHGDPFVAKFPPPPKQLPKAPPPPPPVPMAPPFPYAFMGRMVENDSTTLFLTKQNQSYSVKLNTVLENVYRVDKIDNDQAIFTYLPLNTQQVMYIGQSG